LQRESSSHSYTTLSPLPNPDQVLNSTPSSVPAVVLQHPVVSLLVPVVVVWKNAQDVENEVKQNAPSFYSLI